MKKLTVLGTCPRSGRYTFSFFMPYILFLSMEIPEYRLDIFKLFQYLRRNLKYQIADTINAVYISQYFPFVPLSCFEILRL